MNQNPSTPSQATGRRYWRSLEELADTPEFKEWLHQEFPKGASELNDGETRRNFLKIMSASFALAGLGILGAGCRRPEEKLEPFGKQPENYTFGTAQYYATAMPTRTGALPLVVKSYEGRPVKIEGNAIFPGTNGGTDRYAQASILNLYDPDRARRFTQAGKEVPREVALKALGDLSAKYAAKGGAGLAFLVESSMSPSRARLQKIIAGKFPQSQWFTFDAIDSAVHQRAATQAFGKSVRPIFHYNKAKVILSLDADFLGGEDDSHNHIRKFAESRRAADGMSRLYTIESLFTLTGANADHRLRVAASLIGQIAAAIAGAISGSSASVPAGVDSKWIAECAKDLMANQGKALVIAGQRQPIEVHLLAHAMNSALGALGTTVTLHEAEEIAEGDFSSAKPETLVVIGGNPAYHLTKGAASNQTIVRLGYYEDETSALSTWNFPAAHYLESWGDARTSDGTMVPIQPLIQPLFGGMPELEFLARIAGESQTSAYEMARATFGGTDEQWKLFLYNGFAGGSARAQDVSYQSGATPSFSSTPPSASSLEVVFYRDAKMDDGFYANNGWMQELPDPITKITWDNVVLISRKTAGELALKNGDVVEISLRGKKVQGPVWVQPGMADYSLGLALGYGRAHTGRIGSGVGFNAYQIFSGKYVETGATLSKTGLTHVIATTQAHWSMEGRPAVREANLADFEKDPTFATEMHDKEPPVVASLYPNPLDEEKKTAYQQWGMVVDLGSCVGCATCVVACQSENNIPIVGKDQVLRGREMHWMRIDRYYTSDPKKKYNPSLLDWNADMNKSDAEQQFENWIEDVQAVNQPMLCQMCEAAPCENVCPVNATSHDAEGLNVMTYNRCVGTRYCSNNCPYKVRRFNYFDYNKRDLSELKGPFYPTPILSSADGKWDLATWWQHREAPMHSEADWDLVKMVKNPDVSVRMRGVMEKCTYCVQRIQQAEITQKVKAGQSGNVRLMEADGNIPKTACQQACPAGAIVFGDISDPNSAVSNWKKHPRNYSVLEELLTKPRTTYLARIRNPNPAMPDYNTPYSTEEYLNMGGIIQRKEKS